MKSRAELFETLAQPNSKGVSRWVNVAEFEGKYEALKFNNGWSWGRKGRALDKKFNLEVVRSRNAIVAIRLNGYKDDADSVIYRSEECVFSPKRENEKNVQEKIRQYAQKMGKSLRSVFYGN